MQLFMEVNVYIIQKKVLYVHGEELFFFFIGQVSVEELKI